MDPWIPSSVVRRLACYFDQTEGCSLYECFYGAGNSYLDTHLCFRNSMCRYGFQCIDDARGGMWYFKAFDWIPEEVVQAGAPSK